MRLLRSVEDQEVRDLLAFYGPVGLDREGVECLSRLVWEMESDSDYVAVRRLDLCALVGWLDDAAEERRLKVPRVALSDEEYDRLVGRRVQDARVARGWSQEELAAAVGKHPEWVGGVERGKPRPSVRMVRRLAAALRVPVDSLVSERSETTR